MKKYLVSIFILLFVGIVWAADSIHIPRDTDNGIVAPSIDFVGVNYKLVSHTVSQTAIATVPSIAYGVIFGTAAGSGAYVTFIDSTTASTAGEMFAIWLDTNTATLGGANTRVVKFPPVQTTKGIYVTNSAATFKSTILSRPMR